MGDLSFMPSKVLEMINDELTFIKDTYDDKTIDRLGISLSVYKQMQSENPKYRKPKDEKKGKVNYWWEYYQKKIDRTERVINSYKYAASDFRHDLLTNGFPACGNKPVSCCKLHNNHSCDHLHVLESEILLLKT